MQPAIRLDVTASVERLKSASWFLSLPAVCMIGFGLSLLIDQKADIRGGFLLMSPLIALSLAGYLGPWRHWRKQAFGGKPADASLTARAAALGEKLGIEVQDVLVEGDEQTEVETCVEFWKEGIGIHMRAWGKLSREFQDFVLARRLAMEKLRKSINRPLHYLLWTIASGLACLNLWFILLIQATWAVTAAWTAYRWAFRLTYEQDALAVQATGDLEAAKRFIRQKKSRSWPMSAEDRVAHLDSRFG